MNENLFEAQYDVTKRSKLKKFYETNKILIYSIIAIIVISVPSGIFYSEMKEKILSEEPVSINPLVDEIVTSYNKMFRLGDPANYEPGPEDSFFSEAKRDGKSPQEVAYDMLLEKDGRALIYHPLFNYQPGDLSFVEKMLKHPFSI